MATVTIFRGVSGSGKTTRIKKTFERPGVDFVSVSADHYMVDAAGKYAFDPRRLSDCHGRCLIRFLTLARNASMGVSELFATDNIVVDNTCTTLWEVSPYASVALAYGLRLKVVTLVCDPRVAFERNVHGVPASVILAMDAKLRKSIIEMPPWWNQEVVSTGGK